MKTDLPHTVVTLTGDGGPMHVAKGVLVNGSPVTIAEHGVDIDFGPDEVTTVTLKLLADEVHFVKEAPGVDPGEAHEAEGAEWRHTKAKADRYDALRHDVWVESGSRVAAVAAATRRNPPPRHRAGRTMSAARLRGAAKVLRERAKEARAGKWTTTGAEVLAERTWGYATVATTRGNSATVEGDVSNALFIATMHPGVALALADWLDDAAIYVEEAADGFDEHALNVADQILGDQS